MKALLTPPKLRPPLLTLCWQWSISPFTPLMMMLQISPKFFQPRGLGRSKSVNATSSSMPITPTISWWTVVPMEALLVQTCESSTNPTARSTFQALTTMKLLVLMWSLLQPSSTPLWEKSLASSMNMPTLGRDPPSIHQVNLNGLRPLLMKNPSKLVAPNYHYSGWIFCPSPHQRWFGLCHLPWKTHRSGHGHISSCLLHIS